MLLTRKQWLTKKGLISGKAGRWSQAAHEAIAKAEKRGVKFAEFSPEELAEQKAKAEKAAAREKARAERETAKAAEKAERAAQREKEKAEKPVKTKASDICDVPDPRPDRPNGYYTFRNPDRTTFKRLHTMACARCSYSLQWCYCPEGPVAWVEPYQSGGAYAKLSGIPARSVITTKEVPEKQPTRGTGGTRRGGSRGGRRRRAA